MKKIKYLSSIILLTVLVSCSRSTLYSTSSLYDEKKDFSSYETYAWINDDVPVTTTAYLNNVIIGKSKNYFDHCMGMKGYTIDKENPDLLIKLQIVDSSKIDTVYYSEEYQNINYNSNNPYEYEFPNSHLYNYPNFGVYVDPYEMKIPRNYVDRNIRISIIDRKSKSVIWKGFAKGDLYDVKYSDYDIHPAIHDMLNKYPIKEMKIKP